MQNLGERMQHRIVLLDELDKKLRDEEWQNKESTEELDKRISNELNVLKEETKSLVQECDKLKDIIFAMGKLLREKVPQKEIERFNEKVDNWPIEDFITHKELDTSFDYYSKR